MDFTGKKQVLEFRSVIGASADDTFSWHWQPGAIDRLMPPWESVEVVSAADVPGDGVEATLRVGVGPFKLNWVARHSEIVPGLQFTDDQRHGPFTSWRHLHKFEPLTADTCTLVDRIEYELPASSLSELVLGNFVKRKIRRMFNYRHSVTAADVKLYKNRGGRILKVLVTGSHGLVGSHLIPLLTSQGHQVTRLVRSHPSPVDILWDPDRGQIERDRLEGFDAVVHLAGDNIASGRWTAAKKASILASRVQGTRLLCETLAGLKHPPEVIISASAIGYYGHRADEVMTEDSDPGRGYLADVCNCWEAATASAGEKDIRVVTLRTGVVLSVRGGALAKMLTPFRIGIGGRLGSGNQCMSWVSMEDVTGAIYHALTHRELAGPINVVAPDPVTNSQFTAALGAALNRPTIFPVPGFAARLLLGEMANELLLSGARVKPSKLLEAGYIFRHPELQPLLTQMLSAG